MRVTELLSSVAVDPSGRRVGRVRDIRVTREGRTFRVAGLVVGEGRLAGLAHAWGYAEGRAHGPWLFRALTAHATRHARFVPAARIVSWGPGEVRIDVEADELPPLAEELRR